MLMDHPARAAFACNADEAVAIGAGWIDLMPDHRERGVADTQAGAAEALGHLGLFFVAGGTGTEALVEGADLVQGGGAEGHVGAEHTTHLDHLIAVVGDRQIEIGCGRANFRDGVFGGEDTTLHRGEIGISGEELLDRINVTVRHREVVVEKHDEVSARRGDSAVLHAAFAGKHFVQMNYVHSSIEGRLVERGRRRRAVLRNEEFMIAGAHLRREARDQAGERCGPGVGRDDDREFQGREFN